MFRPASHSRLFAVVGLIHGYALGESIYGAEPTPLYAYLLGLAVIQSAIALAAVQITRAVARRPRPCRHCVWSAPALPVSDWPS